MQKHRQKRIKRSGHRRCRFIITPLDFIDLLELSSDFQVRKRSSPDQRSLRRKICRPDQNPRICPLKSNPGIFPRFLLIRIIFHLCIRIQDKRISRFQLILVSMHLIITGSRDHMVDAIVIPHSRSPLISRFTLLISGIIYGQSVGKTLSRFI